MGIMLLMMYAESRSAEPEPSFAVTIERVSSGRPYTLGVARLDERPYIDRAFAFRKLPRTLVDQLVVQTSMDDDFVDAADHLQLQLPGSATVFVGIDQRGKVPPAWLKTWKLSNETLAVDEIPYHIYEKRFDKGPVTLGGNDRNATGANSNYVVVIAPIAVGPPFDPAGFATKILPLLQDRCFSCHGPDAQEGGLRLDIRRRALGGGDTGSAIVSGSSKTSELFARIATTDETLRMPKDGDPLSADEIELLRSWIDGAAPWPDEFAGREEFSDHWSYKPVQRPDVPAPAHAELVRNPIDAFVLSRMEGEGIEPSPEAGRRTLIRRLSLDLLGLPPEPADVRAFVDDQRPDAYEKLVDRLLESKHFGERWAKHWLDLARFAESDGYENDNPRPHAWRYRDWVIESMNRDQPFDQFTIEQLAGDLLDEARPEQRVATAFHRNTLHNSAGGADAEEFRTKAVKDRSSATAGIWMGLTMNCCECHSHKYDPITNREYYQFYAFFNNTDDANEGESPTVKAAQRITQVHKRGNFLAPGEEVEPNTPAFLPPLGRRQQLADRLDLAHWLVSPEHPLTSRVAVNHIWQHLFGQGLVPTPENFGRIGVPPTHPELLDWLAAEFAGLRTDSEKSSTPPYATPWSRKSLIRLIVLSHTYRQSSAHREEPPAADPDNRLLWRQNRFRMEAETVRDLTLATSGLLEKSIGGPSIQPPLPKGIGQLKELKNERFMEQNGNPYRRGLYVHMQRTFPFPMFAVFDAPDGNQCTMVRDRSTTPMQALTLLNEPTIDECARALGKRLQDITQDPLGRLRYGLELCLSREPDENELRILLELIESQRKAEASEPAIWHGVARTLFNLDEFITRE